MPTDPYRNETVYLEVLEEILANGIASDDRTGTGTLRLFGRSLRFNLAHSFPMITTKWVPWKSVLSELLWFIEGSGDERRLAEILYGQSRDDLEDKTTIWTANARAPYWKPQAQFPGDCGRPYGVQWRSWRTPVIGADGTVSYKVIDQLQTVIDLIKADPNGRRHIVTAWNPGELDQMVLPACHKDFQFIVVNGVLSCAATLRSWDFFLGASFNIASYAILTHMVAQICGLQVGELLINGIDVHLYKDHIEQAKEQLSRSPLAPPQIWLDPTVTSIDGFTMENVKLVGYTSHGTIKAPMAV